MRLSREDEDGMPMMRQLCEFVVCERDEIYPQKTYLLSSRTRTSPPSLLSAVQKTGLFQQATSFFLLPSLRSFVHTFRSSFPCFRAAGGADWPRRSKWAKQT